MIVVLCALSLYFEVLLAALASVSVSVAAIASAFVAKEITTWRKWRS